MYSYYDYDSTVSINYKCNIILLSLTQTNCSKASERVHLLNRSLKKFLCFKPINDKWTNDKKIRQHETQMKCETKKFINTSWPSK